MEAIAEVAGCEVVTIGHLNDVLRSFLYNGICSIFMPMSLFMVSSSFFWVCLAVMECPSLSTVPVKPLISTVIWTFNRAPLVKKLGTFCSEKNLSSLYRSKYYHAPIQAEVAQGRLTTPNITDR